MNIAIFNYGVGNIFSIKKAFEKTSSSKNIIVLKELNRKNITSLDILILPGVGHFSIASDSLSKFKDLILEGIENGMSLFGVCLGMQLLGDESEEGTGEGLHILSGKAKMISGDVKLPHMGWNNVKFVRRERLFDGIENNSYFYFAHSYYLSLKRNSIVIGETKYGIVFPSIVKLELVIGVQFHPEKSGDIGRKLIDNYIRMVRR